MAGPVRAGEDAGSWAILGDRVVRIDHTGSTSVPGLAAKPIIDITMVVPDSSDEPAYVPDLEAAGYKLVIREPEWFEHRVFKGPDTNINLHVFSPGCQEIDRMVGFRDWLRTHDDDRDLYERTKRELASADVGVRPELRRREDGRRRGDRRPGRPPAARRLSGLRRRGEGARALTSTAPVGTVRDTLMNTYFYFRRPA